MHSPGHSATCRKTGKACRFGFPQLHSKRTFVCRPKECPENQDEVKWKTEAQNSLKRLNEIINGQNFNSKMSTDELFQQAHVTQDVLEENVCRLASRVSVILKRDPSSIWVNGYNKNLLDTWNANMDIQYVTNAYQCMRYILSYISKKEAEESSLLKAAQQEAREGNLSATQELKKLGKLYLTHREISIMEAIWRVSGLSLHGNSRQVIWVPITSQSTRLSLPLKFLQTKEKDDENVWAVSLVDRYLAWPLTSNFKGMSLVTFASQYRVLYGKASCSDQEPENGEENAHEDSKIIKLRDGLGQIQKRKEGKHAIVCFPKFSEEKQPEKYYENLLALFLPHYSSDFKPGDFDTFEDYYNNGETIQISALIHDAQKAFSSTASDLDEAWEDVHKNGLNQDNWAQIAPVSEEQRLEDDSQNDIDMYVEVEEDDLVDWDNIQSSKPAPTTHHSAVEYQQVPVTSEGALLIMQTMNNRQRSLFCLVREWCLQKANGNNPKPLRIFLTGGACVAKSHLIKAIRYEATKVLGVLQDTPDTISVLVVASTGTAAFNIEGQTIHSALCINALSKKYIPLKEELLAPLRNKLDHLELLIVDEISMVNLNLFHFISGRLDQIKRTPSPAITFGNISVILVGDLLSNPTSHGSGNVQVRWKDADGSVVTVHVVWTHKCHETTILQRFCTHS